MTRTIKVKVPAKSTRSVDVELPLYRKQFIDSDHGETIIYMRVDQRDSHNLRQVSVTIRSTYDGERSAEIELEDNYHFDQSDEEYTLGTGPHKSSAEEFTDAIARARSLLDEASA